MRMGIPKVVTSDQGTEFNNQLNDELMRLLSIDHRLSTPYHPQVSAVNIVIGNNIILLNNTTYMNRLHHHSIYIQLLP